MSPAPPSQVSPQPSARLGCKPSWQAGVELLSPCCVWNHWRPRLLSSKWRWQGSRQGHRVGAEVELAGEGGSQESGRGLRGILGGSPPGESLLSLLAVEGQGHTSGNWLLAQFLSSFLAV